MRVTIALILSPMVAAACTGESTPSTSTTSSQPSSTPSTVSSPTSVTSSPTSTTPPNAVSTSELTCWTAEADGSASDVGFADVTGDVGLVDPLKGMHGHAAIWTDINHDDHPDLYVGTFADRPTEVYLQRGAGERAPDRLLIWADGRFEADETLPIVFSRSSGGVGADLDNDGDLDLVVSRNVTAGGTPTEILENDDGTMRSVFDSGVPNDLGGRSVAALDYDGDGLLDLFVAEDRRAGGESVLLHNDGDLRFSETTGDVGIPPEVHGLGVVAADLNGDTWTDIFVAGSNRLFLSDGAGSFSEADSGVFEWETFGPEDDVAGVSVADVDRDGHLDLAVGHHFNSTIENGTSVQVRLYLNDGDGRFADVTDAVGLTPIPTKAPHVELNDFNNDGWPDLLTSASAGDGPAIFIHRGLVDGIPGFETPEGLGEPQHWIAAPTADFDRDGRLDVFLLEWEPALPSLLLRNVTEGGNWLEVSVDGVEGLGVGWRVEVIADEVLIGAREITVTQGYAAGVLPVAHFGLGAVDVVDVWLVPPAGGETVIITGVTANQHIRWPAGCVSGP